MATIGGKKGPAHPFRRVAILLVLSLLIAVFDVRGTSALQSIRTLISGAVSIPQSVAHDAAQPLVSFVSDFSQVGSQDEVISNLREQNRKLRLTLLGARDTQRRAAELDALLHTAAVGEYRILPARVMSLGAASGYGSTAMIDVGSQDGVKVGMNVMNGAGLIGRVLTVSARTSVVVLISDAASTVGARIESSGEVGFLSGTGSPSSLVLEFIDPRVRVSKGSRLVSYGVSGGIFTPGIPLGTVMKVEVQAGTNTARAYVRPFADLTALDLVSVVVKPPARDPRDSLLPTVTAIPTVTVTVTATPSASAATTISATASP